MRCIGVQPVQPDSDLRLVVPFFDRTKLALTGQTTQSPNAVIVPKTVVDAVVIKLLKDFSRGS